MSIQKKSLISTLKTAKKANVASASTHEGEAKGSKVASMTKFNMRQQGILMKTTKLSAKQMKSVKLHSKSVA